MKLQPCWYNKVYNRVLINSLRGLDSCFVILRRSGSTNAAKVVKQAPGCHSEEHSDEESVSSAYRFLNALRLSLSSLLGRVRKRPLRSLRSSIRFARHVICGGCRTDAGTSAKQGGEQRGQTSVQAESGIFLVRTGACGIPQAPPGNNCCIRRSAECKVQSAGYDPRIVALLLAGQKLQNPPCNYGRGPYEHRPDASRGVR